MKERRWSWIVLLADLQHSNYACTHAVYVFKKPSSWKHSRTNPCGGHVHTRGETRHRQRDKRCGCRAAAVYQANGVRRETLTLEQSGLSGRDSVQEDVQSTAGACEGRLLLGLVFTRGMTASHVRESATTGLLSIAGVLWRCACCA